VIGFAPNRIMGGAGSAPKSNPIYGQIAQQMGAPMGFTMGGQPSLMPYQPRMPPGIQMPQMGGMQIPRAPTGPSRY
jgi:hypothetical protein